MVYQWYPQIPVAVSLFLCRRLCRAAAQRADQPGQDSLGNGESGTGNQRAAPTVMYSCSCIPAPVPTPDPLEILISILIIVRMAPGVHRKKRCSRYIGTTRIAPVTTNNGSNPGDRYSSTVPSRTVLYIILSRRGERTPSDQLQFDSSSSRGQTGPTPVVGDQE